MRQERAKIHLRAFTISKIFRGLYPRTPVARGGRPSRTHLQHGFAVRGGASRPRLRRPRFSLYPMLSFIHPKREILGNNLARVFSYLIRGFHRVRVD
jgi:hypothetical protein